MVAKGKGGSGNGDPMFGSCWTCGGPHFSKECPQNNPGGIGFKGMGKNAGKGDATAKGKGKGKARAPMYGSCWICGGAHFQADCPQGQMRGASTKGGGKSKGKGKSVREVDEEDEPETAEVGGVTECWSIAEVIEASRNRSGRWRAAKNRPKIRLANQFEALAEVEEVTEDDGEMDLNCPVKLEDHGNMDCTLGINDTMDFYAEAGEGAVAQDIQAVLEEGVVGRGEIVIDSGAA